MAEKTIIWFEKLGIDDVNKVGGKNASLGEMIAQLAHSDVKIPNGFATTAQAYRDFLCQGGLDQKIQTRLDALDTNDVTALAKAGKEIREWISNTPLPAALEEEVRAAYQSMASACSHELAVAVRSSATAEDLPDASFAGQQETFLNVRGIDNVLLAIKAVFASLYNDRAISYRVHQDFAHHEVALSAGIQQMVRSDLGSSGVAFTLDTESGFRDAIFITAAYGLGETVVQGAVNPDEYYLYKPNLKKNLPAILRKTRGDKAIKMVYCETTKAKSPVKTVPVPPAEQLKFCLNNDQLHELANIALKIEQHYACPMDIEWALDGVDKQLYIVQARPETVESRSNGDIIERYLLKGTSNRLVSGRAIGQRIGSGAACLMKNISEMDKIKSGDVLVTDMTDPDWEPIMKRASAIVTNRGGRTCHAAIIARELGIPAVVGCGNATEAIANNQLITVSCAEGDEGSVYEGLIDFEVKRSSAGHMPSLPVKIMMNIGNPARAFQFSTIPNDGVGLARLEFVISNTIGVHPKALLDIDSQTDGLRSEIETRCAGYENPRTFYIEKLVEGISTLAAAFYPKPVIVRMSDFKSNEYANLLAGDQFEPAEENPMLGFRGASRYISESFRPCFELECQALKYVRDEMQLGNVQIMIPFTRTLEEAKQVIALLADNGLKRGENNLKVIMMCEIPSNAVLAEAFLAYFDGFSIGSNDLTQLTLGLDRDSGLVADLFDERNPAVKKLLSMAITAAQKKNKYVGICGQGPSDYPDFAEWLMKENISSISLNPDSVVETWLYLASIEK
ncbi:MAG TPA: phosphoenolpyruvate synthase [Gammaproteobacteria bacterium]|nr:phosphoenolpyruvate synthase [Gammaproteobacteria bacterium]